MCAFVAKINVPWPWPWPWLWPWPWVHVWICSVHLYMCMYEYIDVEIYRYRPDHIKQLIVLLFKFHAPSSCRQNQCVYGNLPQGFEGSNISRAMCQDLGNNELDDSDLSVCIKQVYLSGSMHTYTLSICASASMCMYVCIHAHVAKNSHHTGDRQATKQRVHQHKPARHSSWYRQQPAFTHVLKKQKKQQPNLRTTCAK